jgi:hypothetical protein
MPELTKWEIKTWKKSWRNFFIRVITCNEKVEKVPNDDNFIFLIFANVTRTPVRICKITELSAAKYHTPLNKAKPAK